MRILGKIFAVIGAMVVMSVLTGVIIGLWFSHEESVTLPERMVLSFDFRRPVLEQTDSSPLSVALGDDRVALRSLIAALDRARKDDRVLGLTATVSDAALEPAQIEEVRAALKRFKDSGKFTIAYADSFGEAGPSNRQYWLASAFDEIWLQPLGQLGLTGPAMSIPFARTALDRLGVQADMHERYEYKGAVSTFTQREMPAPLRENYQRLLNDLKARMVADIAEGRKLAPEAVSHAMDISPLLTQEALKAKLIDHIGYEDQFSDYATEKGGGTAETFDLIDYFAALPPLEVKHAPHVALINVSGAIVRLDDESGPFGESGTTSAETLVAALHEATENESIQAIVLRVDSPGGSVTASESIYRAIKQARDAGKFVVVSMGATAASGGYWIAAAADKIVADPSTITGSIGVLSGKFVIADLSDKLGINWGELTTSANGGMWSSSRPFNAAEMQRMDATLDEIYAAFIHRVAEGRNISEEKLDTLARGRVWSGASAKEAGLVDELGGLRTAFDAVRTKLGLKDEAPLCVTILPEPESEFAQVMKLVRVYIAAPSLQTLSLGEALHFLQSRLGNTPNGSLYFSGHDSVVW